MPTAKGEASFGSATPTFGPAVKLPVVGPDELVEAILPNLSIERVRGDGSGQTRKYGNRKVELDGWRFDSKKEASRYGYLKLLAAAGEIRCLEVHPTFELLGRDGSIVYHYTADFRYLYRGQRVVEDCKSVATRKKDTWRIVKKLFRATFGFDIAEV